MHHPITSALQCMHRYFEFRRSDGFAGRSYGSILLLANNSFVCTLLRLLYQKVEQTVSCNVKMIIRAHFIVVL